MIDPRSDRQMQIALLISTAVHLVFLYVINSLVPTPAEVHSVRIDLPSYSPFLQKSFNAGQSSITSSSSATEGVAAKGMGQMLAMDSGEGTGVLSPETGGGLLQVGGGLDAHLAGEKQEWVYQLDTSVVTDDLLERLFKSPPIAERNTEVPFVMDLVELDAERRQRSIALIDPETKKLKRAYWHVPSWRNKPPFDHKAKELAEAVVFMVHGFALPSRVPIETEIHYFAWGYHLALDEMKEFAILFLRYLGGSQNVPDVARYLIAGGFVVVEYESSLSDIEQELKRQGGGKVERLELTIEHPLFHVFYDINRYYPTNPLCPGLGPVGAIKLDGRIVVVIGPEFTWTRDCHANELFVNITAFGLTQPSKMGGQYFVHSDD